MPFSCNATHFPLTCNSTELTSMQVGELYLHFPFKINPPDGKALGEIFSQCTQRLVERFKPSISYGLQQRLDFVNCITEKGHKLIKDCAYNILLFVDHAKQGRCVSNVDMSKIDDPATKDQFFVSYAFRSLYKDCSSETSHFLSLIKDPMTIGFFRSVAIRYFVNSDKLHLMDVMLGQVEPHEIDPVLAEATKEFLKRQDPKKAAVYFDRVQNSQIKDKLYFSFAAYEASNNRPKKALEYVFKIQDKETADESFGKLSKLLIDKVHLKEAKKSIDQIETSITKDRAYYSLIKAYAEKDRIDSDKDYFEKASSITEEIVNAIIRDEAYTSLVKIYAKRGDFQRAEWFLRKIQNSKDSAYRALSKAYADKEDFEQALIYAKSIEDKDIREWAFKDISRLEGTPDRE